jgi:hypothetical protein
MTKDSHLGAFSRLMRQRASGNSNTQLWELWAAQYKTIEPYVIDNKKRVSMYNEDFDPVKSIYEEIKFGFQADLHQVIRDLVVIGAYEAARFIFLLRYRQRESTKEIIRVTKDELNLYLGILRMTDEGQNDLSLVTEKPLEVFLPGSKEEKEFCHMMSDDPKSTVGYEHKQWKNMIPWMQNYLRNHPDEGQIRFLSREFSNPDSYSYTSFKHQAPPMKVLCTEETEQDVVRFTESLCESGFKNVAIWFMEVFKRKFPDSQANERIHTVIKESLD